MTSFEDRLLEHLKQHEPELRAGLAPRRGLAPIAATAVVVAVAAVAAVLLPSAGGSSPTASAAVVRNPDGTVTINWDDLNDTESVNKRLRELGVTNVVVIELSDPGRCTPEDQPGTQIDHPEGLTRDWSTTGPFRTTIWLDRIPPNYTVVWAGTFFDQAGSSGRVTMVRHGVYPTQERYCMEYTVPSVVRPPTPR